MNKKILSITYVFSMLFCYQNLYAELTGSHMNYAWQDNVRGWAAGTNLFNKWQCTSDVGIRSIYRLAILPNKNIPSAHDIHFWKDSLFVSDEWVGGNPTLYFTSGIKTHQSIFSNMRATYSNNLSKWNISLVNERLNNKGGVSSFDGNLSDFVYNKYFRNGWGPYANKPGYLSKIPGVVNYADGNEQDFKLYGYGVGQRVGLSNLRDADQGIGADPNTNSCLHMNPTMFNYDINGKPNSMLVFLFSHKVTTGCKLPNGTQLEPGYYRYDYDASYGWLLNPNLVSGSNSRDHSLNYIKRTNDQFIRTIWGGKILKTSLNTSTDQELLSCYTPDGTGITFSEAHAKSDINGKITALYFIADPSIEEGKFGPAAGLYDTTYVHDIYVAF